MTSSIRFSDLLSNALHDIKLHSGKKISIVQDEIGYALEPVVTGVAIERWRYRKTPPAPEQLEQAARAILAYGAAAHDERWLRTFLTAGDHPYVDAFVGTVFATNAPIEIEAPPMAAYRTPDTRGFIGRKTELTLHSAQLAEDRYTILSGMAGVGKTSLAIEIAAGQAIRPIFWHTFREAGADGLVRRLAGFLANLGSAELWQQLEASRVAGVKPPNNAVCVDALLVGLSHQRCLLCFDDLHVADGDQHVEKLIARLLTQTGSQNPSLLLTMRRIPTWLARYKVESLAGLSVEDTALLVSRRGGGLSAEQVEMLHRYTGGHATFLNFALVLLQRQRNSETLLEQLAATDNVERYLLREVDDHLNEDERLIMQGIAIHAGHLATRDALQHVTQISRVRSVLRNLLDQYLVLPFETVDESGYTLHGIVGGYFILQLTKHKLHELHDRAATYYLDQAPLAAAYHSEQSGQLEQATSLLMQHARKFAYSGDAAAALEILHRLPLDRLEHVERVGALTAIGVCAAATSAFASAGTAFEQAAELLNHLPESAETTAQKVQVCQGMAETLEREDVRTAIEWAQRGLALVNRKDTVAVAALETQLAILHNHTGNFGASAELLDALYHAHLPAHLQTIVCYTLGATYFHLNKLERSVALGREALQLAERLGQPILQLRIRTNLGPALYRQGHWGAAVAMLEKGLDEARRLGDARQQLLLSANLGRMYIDIGRDDDAEQLLQSVLQRARSDGLSMLVLVALTSLCYKHMRSEAWALASQLHREAVQVAHEQNQQAAVAILNGYSAEIHLAEMRYDSALESASKAVDQSRQLGDDENEAIHWRTLGNVLVATRDFEQAHTAYQNSLQLLEPHEYEFALTQLAQATLCIASDDVEQAQQILIAAERRFQRFGAARDLKRSETLRQTVNGTESRR